MTTDFKISDSFVANVEQRHIFCDIKILNYTYHRNHIRSNQACFMNINSTLGDNVIKKQIALQLSTTKEDEMNITSTSSNKKGNATITLTGRCSQNDKAKQGKNGMDIQQSTRIGGNNYVLQVPRFPPHDDRL